MTANERSAGGNLFINLNRPEQAYTQLIIENCLTTIRVKLPAITQAFPHSQQLIKGVTS
jgi:hypothetical protein